jgi:uncharacterized protein (DUF433 family)
VSLRFAALPLGTCRRKLKEQAFEARGLWTVAHRTTMNYMSHPLSVRLNDATIARLDRHAHRMHLAPRTLAQRYVEEGLRMDEHPLIRFAEGPAGRRARLAGTGKDVWEVIATVRDNGGDAAETARYLEIPLGLVQAAITYYGTYQNEIDQWIQANEQEAAETHAAWTAGQAAVKR